MASSSKAERRLMRAHLLVPRAVGILLRRGDLQDELRVRQDVRYTRYIESIYLVDHHPVEGGATALSGDGGVSVIITGSRMGRRGPAGPHRSWYRPCRRRHSARR